MADEESLLEFPCELPIKIFGRSQPDFRTTVLTIVRAHCELAGDDAVAEQLSREGRFVSLTVMVRAESRAALDAVYADLCASSAVLMVL